MELVKPYAVTSSMIVSSNAPADPYSNWVAGAYTAGQRVIYNTEDIYEALTSTSDVPSVGAAATPATWVFVSKINKLRMFDLVTGTQTSFAGTLSVSILSSKAVTSVALFNVTGLSVTVEVKNSGGGVVYTQTQNMISDGGAGPTWYDYLFLESTYKTVAIFTDIPPFPNCTVNITVVPKEGTSAVGTCNIGQQYYLGDVQYASNVGIQDYSRKETDTFGNIILVQRPYSKLADFQIKIPPSSTDAIFNLLSDVRSVPCVFIGSELFESTQSYGFVKDFRITFESFAYTTYSLTVEGLT